jgi:hypothetical protein
MNVVVKKRFIDKDNKLKPVEPGQPLSVSKERGERLISLGFAVASGDDEAKELKESAPTKAARK